MEERILQLEEGPVDALEDAVAEFDAHGHIQKEGAGSVRSASTSSAMKTKSELLLKSTMEFTVDF